MKAVEAKAIGYIISVFINCFINQWLWNIVLVKLFTTIPHIGYWQMFGLTILLNGLFNYKYFSKDD